ncbi:restriction endonuclease subunit S [Enterococcus faecalis]|uniref:restriction endonuclease subunit S n=4 Tax=Enterococcus faecalis TaxID=1351 RepID=UPI00129C2FF7|nr:restriction endonuclease subunit S [Enterococcus faecalis]EGO7799208.1 restriction endonuclease subunit S [Enterococcus faecalis]EGO9027363.1 restriction endonuclease subunit S [Enterococcus faecalis]EHA3059371.1 restriction endonuclease subunit S [Enterococcus faecalis]EHB5083290.1 restriction endonuclease subunit S [Enterococcus faecalis]
MRDEMKKVPRLRFRGFQEDWELCKLSTEFEKVNERNDGSLGKEHWISVAKMYFQNPDKVQSNNIDTRTYVMRTGDIAFEGHPNKEFKFGRFVANDIGTGVVSELFPIYRHKQEYDNYYWKNAIQIERVMGPIFAKSITSSGNSSNKLDPNHFLRQQVFIPKLEEQSKIGLFLKKIDTTIALHQRKLDQLKELKKAYLQVMFPVKDERVPKLRLADFEGEWEQCKFFDMWEKSSDRNKELKYSSKDVLSVAKMTKNPVERNSSDEYMKTYNILHYGDIAFEGNKSKDYSFGRFVLNNLQDGIVSHVFIVFKPKVKMDIDFMKVYINNEYFMKHHLVKATTKTLMMTTLNVQDMNKQKLRIPSLNEQERIGKFFKELDHAITLHQNKLTQLNSLKKSYLQNMFI